MSRPKMLLAFTVITWVLAAWQLDRLGRAAPPPGPYTAIVVAGCRVQPDGAPSLALQRRAERAVALWKQGLAPVVVFTGGATGALPSEARAAADHALTLGLPQQAMVLEAHSTSTEENARNASGLVTGRVLVVSDAYHLWRARRVFGRYFAAVEVAGSDAPLDARARGAAREVGAVLWYWARGRLGPPDAPRAG